MTYTKTIMDDSYDHARVEAGLGEVNLYASEDEAGRVWLCYTPKQARKLAKALKKAAKRAERDS